MSHNTDLTLNKVFAALLLAGVIGMLAGFISRNVITPEYPHEDAFVIEVTEAPAAGGAAGPTGPEPILGLIATADVAKGETLHKQCAACHDFTKGGPNRVGPNLWGVIGRKHGSHEGFAYSDDMKAHPGNWTYSDLNHFLWKPKSFVAGTKMNFIGIKKPEDRAALIAWLRTQSDSPAGLPSEAEVAAEQAELAPPAAAEETPPAEGDVAVPATATEAKDAAVTPADAKAETPAAPAPAAEHAK